MRKFSNHEEAFQKIKTSTGQSDVQELVYKFLTKEQTYATLLTQVNENEKLFDILRKENDHKTEVLHALEIDNDDTGEDKADKSKLSADNIQINKIGEENVEC